MPEECVHKERIQSIAMNRIQLKMTNEAILVYGWNGQAYKFELDRLYFYWSDGKNGIEKGHAEVYDDNPNYLFIILTTASDQSGIVAIVDMSEDKIVHIHEGAFAIKAIKVDGYVLTLYGVYYYGCPFHNMIGITKFENMSFSEDISITELGSDCLFEAYDNRNPSNRIILSLSNDQLVISCDDRKACVDVIKLINEAVEKQSGIINDR